MPTTRALNVTSSLATSLFVSLILPSTSHASRDWHISGAELLKGLTANALASDLTIAPSELNAQAKGYILALLDNKNWCMKGKILPHEAVERVHIGLSKLEPNTLQGNAALLVNKVIDDYCEGAN